jgi:hypothetical protein
MSNTPVAPDRAKELINEFSLAASRWSTIVGSVWIIGAVWTFYLSLAVFGVDLLDKLKGRPQKVGPVDAHVWLGVAVVTTAITAVIAWRRLRRIRRLSRNSAEVEGRVVAIGRFSRAGSVPVTIAYRVGGFEYTTKRDLVDDDALAEGQAIRVLYDPADPGSCEIMPR